jgi:hypothetical protein
MSSSANCDESTDFRTEDSFEVVDGLREAVYALAPRSTNLSILIQHRITFQEKTGRTRASFEAAFRKLFPTSIFAADVNELWTAVHKTDSEFNLGVIAKYCNFVQQHGVVSEFHRCEIQIKIVPSS